MRIIGLLVVCASLVLAGCAADEPSTGTTPGTTTTPATSTPAATTPATSTPRTSTPATTTPSGDDEGEVEIEGFQFQPAELTIARGASVTWKNRDSAPHTATADDMSWNTTRLAGGTDSAPIVFDTAGTFPYFCEVHPTMTGTIVVTG